MTKYEIDFLAGALSEDGYVASLYHRDYLIDANQYHPEYPGVDEIQAQIDAILKSSFRDLCARICQLPALTQDFLHFQLFHFTKSPDNMSEMDHVPHLLSRSANCKRYENGELECLKYRSLMLFIKLEKLSKTKQADSSWRHFRGQLKLTYLESIFRWKISPSGVKCYPSMTDIYSFLQQM